MTNFKGKASIVLFKTVPCPSCGLEVVIVTRRLNPARGKYRRHGGRSAPARSESALAPHSGGAFKIAVDGVPYRVGKGKGDYAEHRCRAKPQSPGLRPTAGFRLD